MTDPLPLHPFTRVSVSQMNTCDDCPLKWYFEKILKLPREEHDHFKFGTVLHACLERIILGEEPFPEGWDADAPTGSSALIRSLVEEGVEVGAVKPGTDDQHVEYKFEIPLGEEYDNLIFLGFIDLLDLSQSFPCVQDHKTVSGNKRARSPEGVWGRYAKTVEGLKEDRQMLLYAWVALCLYRTKYNGAVPDRGILLRHNQYLKRHRNDPVLGTQPRVRMVGGADNMRSAASVEQIEQAATDAFALVEKMIDYAKIEDWTKVPQNFDSCGKFGGCDFRSICHDGVTPEDFAAKQAAMNDLLTPQENDTDAMGLDALNALAGGKPAAPTETAPATVTPAEPSKSDLGLNPGLPDTAPPWAMAGCEACAEANAAPGFNQLGQPCMICVLDATEKGRPLPDQFEIGEGCTWQPASDTMNGALPPEQQAEPAGPAASNQPGGDMGIEVDLGAALDAGQAETPDEPQEEPASSTEPEAAPSEPLAPPDFMDGKQSQYKKGELWAHIQALQAFIAEGGASPFTSQDQPAPAAETAPAPASATGFTLAINCRPGPGDMTLHSLLYGPDPAWANAVCAALGQQGVHAPSWAGTDFFKRRDTLLGAISQLVSSLEGETLYVSTGPAETRDAIEVLRLYADRVIEGE